MTFSETLRETAHFFRKEFNRVGGTKTFLVVLGIVAFLTLLVATFDAGVRVGLQKAHLVQDLDDRFVTTFGISDLAKKPHTLPNPHGTIGIVLSATYPALLVEDASGIEKTILADDDTVIRNIKVPGTWDDLVPGNYVIVIGEPDISGMINAGFIRIIPPPQQPL